MRRTSSVSLALPLDRFAGLRAWGLALLVAAALISGSPRAHAQESNRQESNRQESTWSVTAVAGAATAQPAGEAARPLAAGMALPPRTRVATAEGGRATLARNGDVVEISPGSAIELPADAHGGAVKGVVQTVGNLLYRIVTRPEDPFRVDTPYLAALVKGTVFRVIVTGNGTTLRVDRGAVEVKARRTRDRTVVRAGQTAFAAARTGPGLRITGKPVDQSSRNDVPANASPTNPSNAAPSQSARLENAGGQNAAADGLPPDLESVVRAAAQHPEPAIARAQVETLIGDHPAQAFEIAIAAVRARPEIAAAVARAAAQARPDRATEIIAVIGALAPGQGVGGDGLGDLIQAAPAPMNAGAGPAGARPKSSIETSKGMPNESKRVPLTIPGPSISGP